MVDKPSRKKGRKEGTKVCGGDMRKGRREERGGEKIFPSIKMPSLEGTIEFKNY